MDEIAIVKKQVQQAEWAEGSYPSNHPASTKINPLRRKTSAEGCFLWSVRV